MLGMNTLRTIAGGKLPLKDKNDQGPIETAAGQEPVETAEVRRMYAFANTVDPRLIKLLKLVEPARIDLLRQGRFFDRGVKKHVYYALASVTADPMLTDAVIRY